MKKITFKDKKIYYGTEQIGTYRQVYADRFIPKFLKKWDWVYYQFDFYEGENGDESFFKSKVVESITKVFNCLLVK